MNQILKALLVLPVLLVLLALLVQLLVLSVHKALLVLLALLVLWLAAVIPVLDGANNLQKSRFPLLLNLLEQQRCRIPALPLFQRPYFSCSAVKYVQAQVSWHLSAQQPMQPALQCSALFPLPL